MRRADVVEDLLVLAREKELSAEDSARCERALESSLELKLLLDAGYGFDAQTRLIPGDEAKMQRLVARVMQQVNEGAVDDERRSHTSLRRTRPMLLAMAACLLPVGMAVAWQVVQHSTAGSPVHTPLSMPSTSLPAAVRTPAVQGGATRVPPAVDARPSADRAQRTPHSAAPSRPQLRGSEPRQAGGGAVGPEGSRRATATELFADANLARREGDTSRAVGLYQQLIQAYPESMEAADAHTVLGKLELDRAPASAAWQFRQSQERGSTAEALWGEAESLRRMGSPEERSVLERIVREFPSSPYAPAARARLAKLAP